jgi:hypothetical protein
LRSWQFKLHLIEGKMDRYVYRDILETNFIDTIHIQSLEEESAIFQHDNDSKHSAHYVVDWLLAQKFQVIWHPLQLSDLNPIEHLWNEVDCGMRRSEKKPLGKAIYGRKYKKLGIVLRLMLLGS